MVIPGNVETGSSFGMRGTTIQGNLASPQCEPESQTTGTAPSEFEGAVAASVSDYSVIGF
jgi:hypothetical protein